MKALEGKFLLPLYHCRYEMVGQDFHPLKAIPSHFLSQGLTCELEP